MRVILAAILGLLPALPSSAQDEPAGAPLEARLSHVEGTVYVHLHGQPDDEFIEAQDDAELGEGDLVRTGEDGRAEVTLEGPSVIDVSPSTDFTVTSLEPENTLFGLSLGSIIAKIQRLTATQQMHFATPTAVAAVRGTELSVQIGGEGQPASVGVFDEGHVAVTSQGMAGEVQIGPNQETEVSVGAAPAAPHELTVLAAGRARLSWVRDRQRYWRANWRPRPWAQRRAMRQALLRRPAVRARELRGVSPSQRRPWRAMGARRLQMRRAMGRPVMQRRRQALQQRQRMPKRRFQRRRQDQK